MLDGIKVSNEYFIMKEFPALLLVLCTIFMVVGFIILIIGKEFDSFLGVIIGVVVFACMLFPLTLGINVSNQPSDIKEYQVTIDNSVSMVDFTSKYDIIRVDGEIYTIREKDGE